MTKEELRLVRQLNKNWAETNRIAREKLKEQKKQNAFMLRLGKRVDGFLANAMKPVKLPSFLFGKKGRATPIVH